MNRAYFIGPSGDTTGAADVAAAKAVLGEAGPDEFDEFLREQMQSPEFRAAYEAVKKWEKRAYAGALAVDGHAYQWRLRSRRRRRRR